MIRTPAQDSLAKSAVKRCRNNWFAHRPRRMWP